MTEKKERILQAALKLFVEHGFNGTSTIKIAREAKVSEGLIFKHFKNKQGVLDYLRKDLDERITHILETIFKDKSPKNRLKKLIEMPFEIPESEYDYWRLQYKLKMDGKYYDRTKIQQAIDDIAVSVFKSLGYKHPEQEALLFHEIVDSTFLCLIRGDIPDRKAYKIFLFDKYDLG